eukprot:Nitzschia sp. Nitz4//scaffold114_size70088//65007//68345//NITZ4_005991-RA/size70088-augustus-gene-0.7-mRNA-1//1//CDS//3329533465//8265//frame0
MQPTQTTTTASPQTKPRAPSGTPTRSLRLLQKFEESPLRHFLQSPSRRKGVDKLRVAYTDLLQHIDVIAHADLGRRAVDSTDVQMHQQSKRFSFRRNLLPGNVNGNGSGSTATSTTTRTTTTTTTTTSNVSSLLQGGGGSASGTVEEWEEHVANNMSSSSNTAANTLEQREIAAAFRMLAATRSPDKEGGNLGAMALREDSHVAALASAQAIQARVVELVKTIGVIVTESDETGNGMGVVPATASSSTSSVRGDAVFEYFCEKSILSLLVDIAKEKRQASKEGRQWGTTESYYHGVVWSAEVKGQVFATVAQMVAECRNRSALYYLLSHNYINDLIQFMLPLQQWTDQALSKMVPPYVDMLKKIALKLAEDPDLFPCLLVPGDAAAIDGECAFPLFSAVLETATGTFAQSDSIVYGTCLVVALNIMQIPDEAIQSFVCNASVEQRCLADHLCQRLIDRYNRMVNLTTGPVVDGVRSNALAGQLAALKDQLAMVHEVFWSGIRGLDVRLCESLLQRVGMVLLRNLCSSRRPFLSDVGKIDGDVIPEQEALAQTSTMMLAYLFSVLTYVPFQRMLAVALFHEKSTPLWSSKRWLEEVDSDKYFFMPVLSDIVTGDQERETCPNQFRVELFKGLAGDYGEWRTIACACLFQTALNSDGMDDNSLGLLNLIPTARDDGYESTALEQSIEAYLLRSHKLSAVTCQALEFVGILAVQVLQKTILMLTKDAANTQDRIDFVLEHSPIWNGLLQAKNYFATEALNFQSTTGVSDIFLDLVETVVSSRYKVRLDGTDSPPFRNVLSQRGYATTCMTEDLLVRKFRDVNKNDVETARFYLDMAFHCRALCKVVNRMCASVLASASLPKTAESTKKGPKSRLDLFDEADEITRMVGGLIPKPEAGTDMDWTGRMTFKFRSTRSSDGSPKKSGDATANAASSSTPGRLKKLTEDMGVFRSGTKLLLVLDPTAMYVVRPIHSSLQENRGTLLCTISLRSVIAAAADGDWLHVAVRADDVGYMIKNGNMALQFENNGACLIVKQYLDRSRDVLRVDLLDKAKSILQDCQCSVDDDDACTSDAAQVVAEEKKVEV